MWEFHTSVETVVLLSKLNAKQHIEVELNLDELDLTAAEKMCIRDSNWIDISSTAIRKSKAAIIDISDATPNVMLELGLLKSVKSEKNILMICEKDKSLPTSDLNGQLVLYYTFDVPDKKVEYHFKKVLSEWICEVYGTEREMRCV